jgi:queuosine precursor transporter
MDAGVLRRLNGDQGTKRVKAIWHAVKIRYRLVMQTVHSSAPSPAIAVPRSLFLYALVYGGMAVLAGVLGAKLADVGVWPVIGRMTVESGIFAFLLLIVLSSVVSELHGVAVAQRMVRYGFVPLILSMILIRSVIDLVPPAPVWAYQNEFALILGQGARMQFAGLCSYGLSQTLNVLVFARLAGRLLMVRAWFASLLSQIVDTVIFISLSFWGVVGADGHPLPLGVMMGSQIIAKVVLSTILVPVLVWLGVRLGRALDRA